MHYVMGSIRVDAATQESMIPGLFAAGECAAGMAWWCSTRCTRSRHITDNAIIPLKERVVDRF
jgi:FAD binding domain